MNLIEPGALFQNCMNFKYDLHSDELLMQMIDYSVLVLTET